MPKLNADRIVLTFHSVLTGRDLSTIVKDKDQFLATVLFDNGNFVTHVFLIK